MKVEEFHYFLPPSLIAQYPSPKRGSSRLMVLRRDLGIIEHRVFEEIPSLLTPGDLLILNDTRVLPVRLIGEKETGGRVEILLILSENGKGEEYEVLLKGSKKVRPGARIQFTGEFSAEIKEVKDGRAKVTFFGPCNVMEMIKKIGHIPLPPYIKRKDETLDRERYQTVYAEKEGSIAAPTAGLHFTRSLLHALKRKGVQIAYLTLHIGIGTFSPVKVKNVEDHQMEGEWVDISEKTAQEVQDTKKRGGRVIAVGTTTTRALESFAKGEGGLRPGRGITSLFIYPPFQFRVIDGLITNFHLPKSTLLMLVSAFAGREFLMRAYQEAIEKKYRFYSYGDAMLIL
ncbi:MAG: tRNA preQ1(34) S-adenosylmethionine ribosyltransferase-isomerase QueA [Thermodesulfobacteriota bacterium]